MKDLAKAISEAKGIKDLYPILARLSTETEKVINAKRIDPENVKQMAGFLTDIRLLLYDLAQLSIWPSTKDMPASDGKEMAVRYLELEGRVKEMRNDLDKALKRVRP